MIILRTDLESLLRPDVFVGRGSHDCRSTGRRLLQAFGGQHGGLRVEDAVEHGADVEGGAEEDDAAVAATGEGRLRQHRRQTGGLLPSSHGSHQLLAETSPSELSGGLQALMSRQTVYLRA